MTPERLREILHYDSETGVFVWRVRLARRAAVGDVAGCYSKGYRVITIDKRQHKAHRLAWLYVHGSWPAQQIDHINGDKADNRIANLRDVSPSVNKQNTKRAIATSKSGLLGVHSGRNCTWAQICVDGKVTYLGAYPTPEEAHAAYVKAKRELHEGCTI